MMQTIHLRNIGIRRLSKVIGCNFRGEIYEVHYIILRQSHVLFLHPAGYGGETNEACYYVRLVGHASQPHNSKAPHK